MRPRKFICDWFVRPGAILRFPDGAINRRCFLPGVRFGRLESRQPAIHQHAISGPQAVLTKQLINILRRIMLPPKEMKPIRAASPDVVRIAASFTRAANVTDRCLLDKADFITTFPQPKAKNLSPRCKEKFRIKSAELRINLATNNHAGSDNPGDLAGKSREIFSHVRLVWISGRRSFPLSCSRHHTAPCHPPAFMLREGARQSVAKPFEPMSCASGFRR